MATPIQSIRGMNDILPQETPLWRHLEDEVIRILGRYGYQEIRLPIVESTTLFERGIGDGTDIVEKEMYSFEDRNGDSLSLRPEGTAGCVRAGLQHGLFYNQTQRLWYAGPMFRHERPQKGRYRQFHQVGVEAVGMEGPDIDAELIVITARLWRALGLQNLRLELNSLGNPESRAQYRHILVDYFSRHMDALDEDSQRRLAGNPLRILDSKNPAMQEIIASAPVFETLMDEPSVTHFSHLKTLLDEAGVDFVINPRLVRGLDYYSRTVFEWITDELGAQGTVCAGGRYDGLIELAGGRPTPAVGFAFGIERIIALLGAMQRYQGVANTCDPQIYLVPLDEFCTNAVFRIGEQLRDALPEARVQLHCAGGSVKSRMKRADQSGAGFAILVGQEELLKQVVTLKPLRGNGEQCRLSVADAVNALKQALVAG